MTEVNENSHAELDQKEMKQATEKENKVIKEKAAKNYSSAMEVYAVPVSSFEELMKRNDRIEETY